MARLIVAVECDFSGYEALTAKRCRYDHVDALRSIRRMVDIVAAECEGKAAFLVHTSPFIRRNCNDLFYTSPDYLSIWREAIAHGGELGLHLHEEEPDGSCLYYGYPMHLGKVVADHVRMMSEAGLSVTCESTGYFGLNEWMVPVLEANGINVNLDNIGVYTKLTSANLASSPSRPYLLDTVDVAAEGDSQVLSIPLGMIDKCRGENGFMVSSNSVRYLRSLWQAIDQASSPDDAFFMWVEAHRAYRDEKKLIALLTWLRSAGVQLTLPSEAYRQFMARNRDSARLENAAST